MSLWDVDKGTDKRTSPSPNSSDGMMEGAIKAHSTDSVSNRVNETVGQERVVMRDDGIEVFDAADARILIGKLPDGDYGIVISKTGEDVIDAFS